MNSAEETAQATAQEPPPDTPEQDGPAGPETRTPPRSDATEQAGLDLILDIPVNLSMEVGRRRLSIRQLLQLGQGSIVELDRLAGAPMDVLVNGTLVAHGEVVVVNEKFGIRLTDIVSPSERVRRLA